MKLVLYIAGMAGREYFKGPVKFVDIDIHLCFWRINGFTRHASLLFEWEP